MYNQMIGEGGKSRDDMTTEIEKASTSEDPRSSKGNGLELVYLKQQKHRVEVTVAINIDRMPSTS